MTGRAGHPRRAAGLVARTRIEVVTDGVLLRRLQRDPSLPGVGLLVFDEFHERRLESDLGLAFALETRAALRDDLRLLVTSATLDGAAVAGLLGRRGPVVSGPRAAASRSRSPTTRTPPPGDLLDAVGRRHRPTRSAPDDGDVLVFLPGVRELRAVARRCPTRPAGCRGRRPAAARRAPAPRTGRGARLRRRRAAVASCWPPTWPRRQPDRPRRGRRRRRRAGPASPGSTPATGMTGLVTVPASRGSADQRAGRAGRLAPGRAIRLWPAAAHTPTAGRSPTPRSAPTT